MIGTVAIAALTIVGTGCDKKNDVSADSTAAKASSPAANANEVLVTVNGAKLTRGALEADVEKIVNAQKAQIPAESLDQARKQFGLQLAQTFIMKTLLMEEAKKAGFDKVTPEKRKAREEELIKALGNRPGAPKSLDEYAAGHPLGKEYALREFEDGIIIQEFLEKTVSSKIKVDAKKVDETLARLTKDKEEADKKTVDAEAKIKTLAKQLEGLKGDELKKKFGELAKANSDCPSKEKDGDLGEFTRGRMVKEFEDVAFKQEVGTVSAPVKTQFGWHLILPTKKTPAVEAKGDTPASPEKVQASHILVMAKGGQPLPTRKQIEDNMKRQEEQVAMRKFFDEIRAKATITTPGFPELSPEAKPAAKPAAKSAPAKVTKPAKPASISSKPVAVPTPKPAAKDAKPAETAKPAATPAAKPATKPVEAPATKPTEAKK